MLNSRMRGKLGAIVSVAAVLLPLPLLLPGIHQGAGSLPRALDGHDWAGGGLFALATLLLAGYCAILIVRHILFLTGSALQASSSPSFDASAQPNHPDDGRPWPFVSIVVPAYNEGPVICQSIRSLLDLHYPYFEIIVVDDGSTDDTYRRAVQASETSDRLRVIRKANGGKASALNVGMAHARGTLILNVDADSKLSPNAVYACVRHFLDPAVGAVAGNIKVANRENLVTRLQAVEYIEGLALERRAQSMVKAVSVIGGPLGMFRKSALIQVGGYDSDTFAEDRDVTLKLLDRGWTVTYEPHAEAWAESPSRLLDLLNQRYRWTRGTVQAIFKHQRAMWQPRRNLVMWASLWYMAADSLVAPAANLFILLFFSYLAFALGNTTYLLFWWTQVALFDVVVTCYCIVLDREDVGLVPYALLFRMYAIIGDVAKLLATIEELLQVDMTWGKLKREGKL